MQGVADELQDKRVKHAVDGIFGYFEVFGGKSLTFTVNAVKVGSLVD
jgi:hypothetical protein